MSDSPYAVLEDRIEEHHSENKLRFATVEERVRLLEVAFATTNERGEQSLKLLEKIEKKLEAPHWWIIAGIVVVVAGLVFQAGRYPDRDELRGVAARLGQVEADLRVQRTLIDANSHRPTP